MIQTNIILTTIVSLLTIAGAAVALKSVNTPEIRSYAPMRILIVQIPTENYDQASDQRNYKQRTDVIIILFGVFEIKNLNVSVGDQK